MRRTSQPGIQRARTTPLWLSFWKAPRRVKCGNNKLCQDLNLPRAIFFWRNKNMELTLTLTSMTFCQQSNHQIMTICCNPWKVQYDSIGIQIASILPFLAVTGVFLFLIQKVILFRKNLQRVAETASSKGRYNVPFLLRRCDAGFWGELFE